MRNTFINSLLKEARNSDKIILLTGDLGYGVVDEFAQELPKQFMNFGINEQTMMSAAAGLASQGYKPFVYSIGNFPTFRCLEQIRNDVCYMNLDVTIVALGAGFAYGTAGYSHHLIEDISAMSALPNIRIFSPADTLETRRVVQDVLELSGPKYVRLGKGGEVNVTQDFDVSHSGLSIYEGNSDFAIVTTGNILSEALKFNSLWPQYGATILSCFNFEKIEKFLHSTSFKKIVTLEEHVYRGGFGSFMSEISTSIGIPIRSVAINKIDSRVSGPQSFLREHYGLTAEAVKKLL